MDDRCKGVCRGSGTTGMNPGGIMLSDPPYPCPDCNGTGSEAERQRLMRSDRRRALLRRVRQALRAID